MNNENELTAALATIEKCRELSGCPAGVDLQDWVNQLAAENVGLKAAIPDELFIDVMDENIDDISMAGDLGFNACVRKIARTIQETPATDRIVAGIKADGVEEFAEKLRIPGDDPFFDAIAIGLAGTADQYAKQLREGADK